MPFLHNCFIYLFCSNFNDITTTCGVTGGFGVGFSVRARLTEYSHELYRDIYITEMYVILLCIGSIIFG